MDEGDAVETLGETSIGRYQAAIERLLAAGYTVVRVGDPAMPAVGRPDVVNLTTQGGSSLLLSLACVLRAEVVVAEAAEVVGLAQLAGAASLRIDAVDPLEAYPAGTDGFLLPATVVERASGRPLPVGEQLAEDYRDRRGDGAFLRRKGTPEEIDAAVAEVLAWRDGAAETERQRLFRERASAAAERLQVPTCWCGDPFLGEGRIVDSKLAESS